MDDAFCHACVFFAPENVGGQAPGQYITKPFKYWVSKSQKMEAHAKADYLIACVTKMGEFLVRFQNPSKLINTMFDKESQKRMDVNQTVIEALLKIMMVCGR